MMNSQNNEESQYSNEENSQKDDLELREGDFISITDPVSSQDWVVDQANEDNIYLANRRSSPTGRPKRNQTVREIVDWIVTLSIAIVLAMIIRTYLFAIFVVDGESMYPTMTDSEWLVVNKAIYHLGEPNYGDIVVFHASESRDYIKRVIAIGGDSIEIVDGQVYVNDILQDEDYINEEMIINNYYPRMVIPEGKIFVMGDNRNRSADSRMHEVGYVALDKVVGRAEFVFWPMKEAKKIK